MKKVNLMAIMLFSSIAFAQKTDRLDNNKQSSNLQVKPKKTFHKNTNEMEEYRFPENGRGSAKVAYQGSPIDQMIYEFMEDNKIPGMTLAIVQAPYIPRVVSYGVTHNKEQRLTSAKTIFPAGPISQGFTAVAIMQLYERGELDIYAPISKYLRSLPKAWKNITIHQLLQHSSGIADYRNYNNFDASNSYTENELLNTVKNVPLAFTPGSDIQLSATNFLLLAEIVEKQGKMPYKDFITKYQIDFLDLKQTFHGDNLDKVKQEDLTINNGKHKLFLSDKRYIAPAELTQGYVEKDGKLQAINPTNAQSLKGFSDIWASAENISIWDIALAGNILIKKPENRKIIYSQGKLSNGKKAHAMAGWQFYNHKGLMDAKGSAPGHSSFLSRFTDPSELVCVTLLANKEGVDLTNIARKVAGAFDTRLSSGYNDNDLFTYESQFSVEETTKNIEVNLKKNEIPVFSVFDHSKNAEDVNLNLRPTKVIVFGSPKVGTKLMQENQSIAGELPLKITVWEDKAGSIWVSFPRMKTMAKKYGLENHPIIEKMQHLLQNLVKKSSSIY